MLFAAFHNRNEACWCLDGAIQAHDLLEMRSSTSVNVILDSMILISENSANPILMTIHFDVQSDCMMLLFFTFCWHQWKVSWHCSFVFAPYGKTMQLLTVDFYRIKTSCLSLMFPFMLSLAGFWKWNDINVKEKYAALDDKRRMQATYLRAILYA
jgi:hypothetical protein